LVQRIIQGEQTIDGWIRESFKSPARYTIDMATQTPKVLFDHADRPTGAVASASQAPFFSEPPVFIVRDTEFELSVEDMPGGAYSLELRNAKQLIALIISTVFIPSRLSNGLGGGQTR
jgi:hypothetical protein